MIINKDKQAILLNLKDPQRVLDAIPKAKVVVAGGHRLVAVPHRPEETRILKSLGFDPPEPMKIHYPFPGKYPPFDAQRDSASFMTMNDRNFCLNSMGLGKTMTALWAYDYLRSIKQVQRALIVCPLSTMERTWAVEAFKSFPQLDVSVLYGSKEKRVKLLAQDAHIYIINADGLKTIRKELAARSDIDLIIVDEIATFRNAGTDRWKALNDVCNKQKARKVWGLTGMPTPNAPTDAWAQCRIVIPQNPSVPQYFNRFRDSVMKQVNRFLWKPRADALDVVKETMQPSIRFALDDCVDLPPQLHESLDAPLTPEQHILYKSMMSKLEAEYEGGQILAVNEAVKAGKLVQIACGVAYGPNGEDIKIPMQPRLDVLKEAVEASEGKVIVFVPLTGVLEVVAEELRKTWTVSVIHGGTPKNERDETFKNFETAKDPHILVANPGTMSHGLSLVAATNIIWFAPVYSNDIYEQACARVRRPGQTKTTVIIHIAASAIERSIYDRLKVKGNMQGILLDMMKEVI